MIQSRLFCSWTAWDAMRGEGNREENRSSDTLLLPLNKQVFLPGSAWAYFAYFAIKIKKNSAKSFDFAEFWSEWGDSNSRHLAPKCVSEPSTGTLPPSLALSSAPAIPLWHSFALLVSRKPFVFWDSCGIGFCILKDVPPGLRGWWQASHLRGAAQKIRRINKE